MSDKEPGVGGQLMNVIQEAFDTMNFSNLDKDISAIINNALDDSREKMRQVQYTAQTGRRPDPNQRRQGTASGTTQAPAKERRRLPIKQVGKVSNNILMGLGGAGLGINGLSSLMVTTYSLVAGDPEGVAIGLGFFLPVAIICGVLFGKGLVGKRRLDRLNEYVRAMKGVPYISVEELAKRTGYSEKKVVKDLKKMIQIGIFPQGHLNQKEDYFMMDDVSYQQYREAYNNDLEMERQKDMEAQIPDEEKELRAIIATGENYISQIRKANDAIPGKEVSEKLDRLEFIIARIFEALQKYPEKRSEMERFMEYYMPTTLKLVNTYKMLDEQPVQGENITTAKAEIEKTLDSINVAYEKLYDDMFQQVAWDISTDISVMENMFKREGLKEEEFKTSTMGS
ncbi:MAG: 5-bromo-4-chloroindolyl phosphate hydrolysis family protein [Lachnospiraceae bacterium]|nr:5-bromo-4-chloroindolyl phosphate hydrolysis family protein [Lachnospiraceae bacterium]